MIVIRGDHLHNFKPYGSWKEKRILPLSRNLEVRFRRLASGVLSFIPDRRSFQRKIKNSPRRWLLKNIVILVAPRKERYRMPEALVLCGSSVSVVWRKESDCNEHRGYYIRRRYTLWSWDKFFSQLLIPFANNGLIIIGKGWKFGLGLVFWV